MLRQIVQVTALAVAAAAAPSRADIMHWFWEVEVNGHPVQTDRPIGVNPGDYVHIDLWAEFAPHNEGFAWAVFSVDTGDHFFEAGDVSIARSDGNGLSTYLDGFGANGEFADSDATGQYDTIDAVSPGQYPPFFNAEFDGSNPLRVFRIGWDVQAVEFDHIELAFRPTLEGDFGAAVYLDAFGAFAEYDLSAERVAFVPAPWTGLVLVTWVLVRASVRRAHT